MVNKRTSNFRLLRIIVPAFCLGLVCNTSLTHADPQHPAQGYRSDCHWPPIQPELFYKGASYPLENVQKLPYPYGSFVILVDKAGTGHVQSGVSNPKQAKVTRDFLNLDWKQRTSYMNPDKSWAQLSLKKAKEFWGEPREHNDFYTFDGHTNWNHEPNLYHLDFKFGADDTITAYRVRGIGISNPQWVSEESTPASGLLWPDRTSK